MPSSSSAGGDGPVAIASGCEGSPKRNRSIDSAQTLGEPPLAVRRFDGTGTVDPPAHHARGCSRRCRYLRHCFRPPAGIGPVRALAAPHPTSMPTCTVVGAGGPQVLPPAVRTLVAPHRTSRPMCTVVEAGASQVLPPAAGFTAFSSSGGGVGGGDGGGSSVGQQTDSSEGSSSSSSGGDGGDGTSLRLSVLRAFRPRPRSK